jgi:subtilase family serine protease
MGLINRPVKAAAIGVVSLAMTAVTGALVAPAAMSSTTMSSTATGSTATGSTAMSPAAPAPRGFAAISDSLSRTADKITGTYHSGSMSVEVVLRPSHETALNKTLAAVYDSRSSQYHHWLAKGQFTARFAPSAASTSALASYLKGQGLKIGTSSSPFLLRATGSSARISAAFKTSLSTFRDPRGKTYFANSSTVKLPVSMVSHVLGVVGLSSTVREQPMVQRATGTIRPSGRATSAAPGCEQPYPTRAQFFANASKGTPIPFGYGAGPGCNGLTPSQDNSLYGAPHAGAAGKGKGVNIAVFELSAYQKSDISTWAHTFYGSSFAPPLKNIIVDGGPRHAQCPAGDMCPKVANFYSGDIEVDADIEIQLAIAPDVQRLSVYEAPNDFTGQTTLDLYAKIANDDSAAAVSSSWAVCENDAGAGFARAENAIFEQMALQGESMFGAAGDTGAFACIRSDGTTIVNVLDPPSQPWVTSVGGTSFDHFNPGEKARPSYPKAGTETVWNVDSLCNSSGNEGKQTGFFWCAQTGAGGGGSSQFWGRPAYQHGPGINNAGTQVGNGKTRCMLAKAGTPCREVPDISANADEYTPYAEFCTGSAVTPESVCATFSGGQTPPGWFGIGGTSLSSPLWSAIFADRDSFQHQRAGNANVLLYSLLRNDYHKFFHDITGIGQNPSNNGLFPVTRNYDMATGIGTPRMSALITSRMT